MVIAHFLSGIYELQLHSVCDITLLSYQRVCILSIRVLRTMELNIFVSAVRVICSVPAEPPSDSNPCWLYNAL